MAHLGSAVPAYGRDYKTAKATREDWDNGKDFCLVGFGHAGGSYINKHDCPPGDTIQARFDGNRKVVILKA